MSCARVKKYTSSDVSKAERHNERKNETYENMNVIAERIPYNVHFKKPNFPNLYGTIKADGTGRKSITSRIEKRRYPFQ